MSQAGSEVMGVDWRVPLDSAAERICQVAGPRVLQGNLDPAILFSGEQAMAREITRIKGKLRLRFPLVMPRDTFSTWGMACYLTQSRKTSRRLWNLFMKLVLGQLLRQELVERA